MTSRRAGVAIAVAVLCSGVGTGRAQVPASAIVLPGVERPPVALIVAPTDVVIPFQGELNLNGIATLIAEPVGPSAEGRIRHLTGALMMLRNDARFPTVIVIGLARYAREAAITARIARADGFVAVGATPDADADITRLVVDVHKATGARYAKEIADFARRVSPLGRRGSRESRPVTPRRSPRTLAFGTVGGSLVSIEYGAPQKRGREIWGALVPWNRVWMPGADESTTLTTSAPLSIGDLKLSAGDYTVYVDPREDRMQLLISSDVGVFHTVYDSQKVIGRVDMTMLGLGDPLEGLTFAVTARDSGTGAITMSWDSRSYSVPISVVQ